ncbi:FecR domain-containing protein [Pedobacter sp. N36a]|uniref:FecR family protein n=1 Tax=Pedobacter sp. N36a TaxID=2767996 RepID=UPI0016571936|nr:FecR domain-containing protein [Pedobacter sp. N36a]MBC8986581.1 FecR domain-containing protein [Pedobacter sp. N36a]
MKRDDTPILIQKYINGTCTKEEREQLLRWYRSPKHEIVEWPDAPGMDETAVYQRIFSKIEQEIDSKRSAVTPLTPDSSELKTRKLHFNWQKIAVAAALILTSGIAVYFYQQYPASPHIEQLTFKNEVKPGGNKAILKLADGTELVLDGAKNGALAQRKDINFSNTSDGQLAYNRQKNDPSGNAEALNYNTVSTPKGGQYRIILPDGTKVWLNAASSIRFPTNFLPGERKVTISGEVYFEVAKNKHQPFRVIADKQILEVLGTKFNISAYKDAPQISTTLAEGSVKLGRLKFNNYQVLKPGEQAQMKTTDENPAKISAADLEEVLAWKNDAFVFNNTPTNEVMKQMERWYNVELVYKGTAPDLYFTGVIPRESNLSTFLSVLEGTGGVKFGIEQNKVIIQKIK